MKVAIVGSSGYIAGYLIKRFQNEEFVEGILKIDMDSTASLKLDLRNPALFDYEKLRDIDFVIFTAAISSPDVCAKDFDLCWDINVVGTKYFIEKALERNCKVLFFSSDAVFGDIPGEIYDEESETCAKMPYGKMKKYIEDEFKGNKLFKAIRLSYVASAKDKFISYCLNCIAKNEVADVFHPFYRNVISVSDVENVVVWMTKNWENYKPFVLNVAGDELVSRIRIADEINRHLENKLKYVISTPNDKFYQNRPAITQMKSLYIQKYNIIENRSFTEKIKAELKNYI